MMKRKGPRRGKPGPEPRDSVAVAATATSMVSSSEPEHEPPEEIGNSEEVSTTGNEIVLHSIQHTQHTTTMTNSSGAGDPNPAQETQNQTAEARPRIIVMGNERFYLVPVRPDSISEITNDFGSLDLNHNFNHNDNSHDLVNMERYSYDQDNMERSIHPEAEQVPDSSTSCRIDCSCPSFNDVQNYARNYTTEKPKYIKEHRMPITVASLVEPVIARAHQPCATCLKIYPTFQCRGCYKVSYCSVEHQRQHWQIHQSVCAPLVYSMCLGLEHEGISPVTHAARDLDTHDVLVQIPPIIIAPINRRGNRFSYHNGLCLGCCRWFSFDTTNISKCANCHWPVCSFQCQNNPRHAKFECTIFKKHNVHWNQTTWIYDAVLALRCLMLKTKDPASYEKLVILSNLAQVRERSPEAFREDQTIALFLMTYCKVDVEFKIDKDFLLTILKVVESCSVSMPEYPIPWREETTFNWPKSPPPSPKDKKHNYTTDEVNEKGIEVGKRLVSVRFVILTKHNFMEDCSPNTRWTLHYGQEPFECYLKITSTVPILQGKEILVCWNTDSEFGTIARRRMSAMRFKRHCVCSRCLDESENDSNFGTFLCEKCAITPDPDYRNKHKMKVGLVRSKYPLDDMSECFKYRCTTKGCTYQISRNEVLARLGSMLPKVEAVKDSVAGLRDVIEKFGVILHQNHYIMIRAKHYIISNIVHQIQMSQFDDVPITLLELAGILIDDCLAVHAKISPGQSLIKGRLLFQRMLVNGVYTVRMAERYHMVGMAEDLIHCSENLLKLQEVQLEAHNILKDDPEGTYNHECAMKLKRLLEDYDDIVFLRRTGEPLKIDVIRRVRRFLARLTSDREMAYEEYAEDPELYLFQLGPNDIPPVPPSPPPPRQYNRRH